MLQPPLAVRRRAPSACVGAFFALLLTALPLPGALAAQAAQAAQAAEAAEATEDAGASPLERILALGRDDNRVQDHLRVLTQELGPRLTSSSNLERAERWCRDRFASWGLDARLEQYDEWAVGFDRGTSSGRMVAPEERELTFITRAWSRGTDGPVRGPAVLEPESLDEMDTWAAGVGGAWVVQRARARGEQLPRDLRRAIRAATDAAGVLGTIRSGSRDGRLVMSGRAPGSMDELPETVAITLHTDDCADLVARLGRGEPVELEFNIDNRFRRGPIPLHNVLADIRGTEFPDEFVLVQAHLDSWDGAEGACDNGTGVATTLEAARLLALAGVRPRRTIRFVLYSGEEQGLHGSRGYVREHADELEHTSVVLNHDNGTKYLAGIGATEAMRADFEWVFAPVRSLDAGRPFEIRAVEGLRPGPSDHAPFVRAGVPGFHWSQSNEGYRRVHHTQHDVFAAADSADQQHSALVAAIAAYRFASLDGLVDRTFMAVPEARKMGVYLAGTEIQRVLAGKAQDAGWQVGDVVLAIDGTAVETQAELVSALQAGGPRKVVSLRRGGATIESVLDYTDDPAEVEREARRKHFEERAQLGDGPETEDDEG